MSINSTVCNMQTLSSSQFKIDLNTSTKSYSEFNCTAIKETEETSIHTIIVIEDKLWSYVRKFLTWIKGGKSNGFEELKSFLEVMALTLS